MSSELFSRSLFVLLVSILSVSVIAESAIDKNVKDTVRQESKKDKYKTRFTSEKLKIDPQKSAERLSTGSKFNGKDSFWWQNFRKAYSHSEFAPASIDDSQASTIGSSELDNSRKANSNNSLDRKFGLDDYNKRINKTKQNKKPELYEEILGQKPLRERVRKGELPVNPSFSAASIESIKGDQIPDASKYRELLERNKSRNNKSKQKKVNDVQLSKSDFLQSYDNQFDMIDFSLIASNWLKGGENLSGDYDNDSVVNLSDLQYLFTNWLAEDSEAEQQAASLIDMNFEYIKVMSYDPNDPNSIDEPNDPDPVEDLDPSLYYADDLPYQTSFEAMQGYVFDNQNSINNPYSIDGQQGWCVESGDFGVINSPTVYFDGPIDELNNPEYYFEGTQSVLYSDSGGSCYKEINDNGDNRFVRFEIWPAHNSEFIIADGDEIVTAIKFNFDESLYDPNDPNNGAENIFCWEPDPNEGEPRYIDTGVSYAAIHRLVYNNMGPVRTKFVLDVDWENERYDIYLANPFSITLEYSQMGWNVPLSKGTFDRIKLVNSGDESFVFDRLLICDEDFDSVVVEINSPCHCDYEEGGLAKALTPVMGRYMGYDTAGYSILCCPKDDGDMNWFEDWDELVQSFIDNKWIVSDMQSKLVPDSESQLGWWRTGLIPNGYYYWSVLVYSDITTSSGYMLPWYCYWLSDARTVEGTGETYEVWPAATIPVAGYQKSNPYTTEYSTAIKVEWPGEFPFELKHYYNSGRATKSRPFYSGWSCNYEYTLAEDTRFQYESEYQAFLGDVPYHDDNYLGYGLISIQFPDGSGHVFRRKDEAGNSLSSESLYYPYPEVTSRNYVKRETYSTIENGTYYINRIRYTLVTGDGKELVFDEDNLNVEMDTGGTVGWVSEPVFESISDRFGNTLNIGWVGDRIDSISYGQGDLERRIQFYDDGNDGMIEKALLLVGGDEYNPLRTVKYGISYWYHGYYSRVYDLWIKEFYIRDYNDGVDNFGYPREAEDIYKSRYFGYHPEKRQHIIYEFDRDHWWDAYINRVEVSYDDWGRVKGLMRPADYSYEFVDGGVFLVIRGPVSVFEYDYYHPDLNDIYTADPNQIDEEGRWQKITRLDTAGEMSFVPSDLHYYHNPFIGAITQTVKDDKGRVQGSHLTTIDDCGEKLTEYSYADSDNSYKPTEIKEEFDNRVRMSGFVYDDNGNLISKEVEEQGSSDIKKETYSWHQSYDFPTGKSTWQQYGDSSTEVTTEYVYGRANGTVSSNPSENIYLIEQWQLLNYNDSDPNDSVWAQTKYRYRTDGQVIEIIDPENKRQSIEYDDLGYKTAVFAGPAGNEIPVSRRINSVIGQPEVEVDSAGKVTVNKIDGHGRIYQKNIYDCRRVLWDLDDPNVPEDFGSKQAEFRYSYNLRDMVTCERNVDYGENEGGFTFTRYYSSGQPALKFYVIPDDSEEGGEALEAYEKFRYNGNGQLWDHYWLDKHLGSGNEVVRAEINNYDDLGRKTNNLHLDYLQDESDNSETTTVLREVRAKYSTEGNLVEQVTYGNGVKETVVACSYDIFGRKISSIVDPVLSEEPNTIDGLSLETKFYYDLADNTIKTEDPKGNITFFAYDNANRKVSSYFTANSGTTIENAVVSGSQEYYKNGQLMESTAYDRDGASILDHSFLSYDDQNRIVQVDQDVNTSLVASTSIYYNDGVPLADPNYFIGYENYDIRIIDAEDKSTWRQLDYNGQITELLYPSGLSQQMTYYTDGKLKARAVWSETGQKLWVEYLRDSRGRVVKKRYPDGKCIKYYYDGFSRTLSQGSYIEGDDSDPNNIVFDTLLAEYNYSYDVFDQVSSVEEPDGFVSFYGYRGDGQLASINITDDPENDPNGFYQAYFAFDHVGRNDGLFTGPETSDLAMSCVYDDNGNLENIGYHNGSLQSFSEIDNSFNLDNQLTGIDSSCYDLTNVTIDGLGRITGGSESVLKPDNSTIVNSLSFSYNRQGSLITSYIGNWCGYYSYHKDGNISARYKSGTSESFGYDFDGDGVDESNMLTSVGGNDLVDWDDSGNLVCDGISTFSYNYDNKMLNAYGIDEPNVFVAIGYDCANNRVYRVSRDVDSNYTVRKYLLDYSGGLPKVLVELELDGSGGWDIVAQNYHYGDRLISSIDSSGNSRFYIHDRNGNVRNVINSSGSVLNSYTYTPYGDDIVGKCVETVDNNWKYTGQYHDKEIGQYYLRARMYSPYLSRFNGYDPVYGGYTEPLTLHQYLYCLNDPVNRVDLSGRFSLVEQNAVQGIGNAINYGSGAYDAANMVKDLAEQVASGATFRNIMIGVAANMLVDHFGGKLFDKVASLGSNVMRRFRGGRHGDIKLPWGDGLESHHMPAKTTYNLDVDDMPAIQMDPPDHWSTSSYGSSANAKEYRKAMSKMIEDDRMRAAMAAEIRDVRRVAREAGNHRKYNEAIFEMLDYAKSIGLLDK